MLWVTRENVKVGRIACSWLIRRCIDPEAEIRYLPQTEVTAAMETGAVGFHVRGGFNHQKGKTPFELLLEEYDLLGDGALALLGRIVNGADTDNATYHQPEGPGVRAVTEGYRAIYGGDEEIVARGAELFDALYAYCGGKVGSG